MHSRRVVNRMVQNGELRAGQIKSTPKSKRKYIPVAIKQSGVKSKTRQFKGTKTQIMKLFGSQGEVLVADAIARLLKNPIQIAKEDIFVVVARAFRGEKYIMGKQRQTLPITTSTVRAVYKKLDTNGLIKKH